jgi:peptidoglycan/LPS O-acetylase OafA/YrhL
MTLQKQHSPTTHDEVVAVSALTTDTWNTPEQELPPATQHTATGAGKDLPNLDLLRSVAVISVLVAHISGAIHQDHYGLFYGAFGVGIFFLHTALVLMWSLERRPNALDFYIRRIARIYPLSIVIVLLAVFLHAKVSSFPQYGPFYLYAAPTFKQTIAHVLLIQNFFSGNFIVYPMWSLPIEVQMYVLLPALSFYLRRKKSLWPLLLAWVFFVAILYHFGARETNLSFAIPFFLPGLIGYVGFSTWTPRLPGWSFLLFLGIIVWIGGHSPNWPAATWPCLALGLLLPNFRQLRPGPLPTACWHIARYSYGIYLTHPFAILLGLYVCRHSSLVVQYGVLFTSLTVFSVVAYHLVEAPCMHAGARLARSMTAPASISRTM